MGTLLISDSDSRAMNVSDIVYAKVYVSGTGISSPVTNTDYASVVSGENDGTISVNNIPTGKNRVVTVFAYDSEKEKLGTVMLRAVTDIKSGTNSVSVNKSTTALGNVFASLLDSSYDLSTVTSEQKNALQNAIDSIKNWSLINTSAIASDFKNGGVSGLKSASAYIRETGSISFKNYNEDCTIQVGDPVSSIKTNVASGEGTLSGIAPGNWPVYVISEGEIVFKTYANVTAGEDFDVGNLGSYTDKIVVHAKDYVNIYIFDTDGVTTGHNVMTEEEDGWYVYTIGAPSANLIFTKALNGWDSQTADLSRTAGEWWFVGGEGVKPVGTWYDSNPDDSESPVLSSFTCSSAGTVTGEIEFTFTATDNKNLAVAQISLDSAVVKNVTLSGKSAEGSYTLDSGDYANGVHSVSCVVYDKAGNVSSIKLLSLTFQNVNKVPTAVITGSRKVAKGKTSSYSAEDSVDKNGSVVAYEWTVTGATPSTGTSSKISVTFPDAEGTVTIKLRVKDNDGDWSEWVTKEVQVITPAKTNDFREETIYFVMTARFFDGDETNNRWCRADDESGNRENNDHPWRGDFKGLIQKLDYIKALGFSAIWITPVVQNRSDYDFHGYHAWNMNKVDARLESTDTDYQDLIDACHAKGIKVIQDIVLNHSCRYGLEDLFVPKYWGDRDNKYWGTSNPINYYDEYNPDFTYNGLDYEPISGKCWYNGDLWQKEKPTLPWNPDLSHWGVSQGWNENNREWYGCQWPDLALFNPEYFHTGWLKNWEDETCQTGTIHEDCIDLNTENATVQKYLIDAYSKYISMGVDAFRVDTVKHMSRNTLNRRFIPAFMQAAEEAGNEHFYMFGEVCSRVNEVWNHNVAPLSTPFYTWKERTTYSDDDTVAAHEAYVYENGQGTANQPKSNNHLLNGNNYHTPDYSNASGMNVIDFPMHWNFSNASSAYDQKGNDIYYNDATWNVVYVDSHDYGPNMDTRYPGDDNAWAENMTFMWTFRGIPCLYYGSEIRFKSGADADKGAAAPLEATGRAYYGNNIEGEVTATDYGVWTNASGAVATTLAKPLCAHVARLNRIRRAVPALQKGQYSNEGCSGGMSYKRRFTDAENDVDSFVLVTVSGGSTFSGIPGGTYVDLVTGDRKTVSEGGTLTANCNGQGNARIYVLQNATATEKGATGKIGDDTNWLK